MATRRSRQKSESAKQRDKDFVGRLADAGEDALQKLAELPGGTRVLGGFNDLRNRVDELSKKMRGIDELEARVARLEKQFEQLKPPRSPAARSRTKRTSTT
jgi:outer membrane murein-binding lipoprotein Lpp